MWPVNKLRGYTIGQQYSSAKCHAVQGKIEQLAKAFEVK